MKEFAVGILVLVLGGVIGWVIDKTAELALTGSSYLFLTKVYGGLGVRPLSVNISVSGALGLIISFLLILRLIRVMR